MTLSEELTWRGFVNQTTFADITELDKTPLAFYWGVDPSAASMQIGNLAAAMMVRHFIEHGHKAYLLLGGATGLIGDPDGKAEERSLKTLEQVAKNKAGIAVQYRTVFADQKFEVVDNYDWFKDINYIEFLRDVGKHVPMRQMLGRDFVQSRLGEDGAGISYAEFSYSLIQGYDFVHLNREFGVTLQLCGADQWGNSVAGVDLLRRMDGKEAHVWSTPLIVNKATGVKFGKTEDGAIWLDSEQTSVFKFYQFWLNVDDEGVSDYLKVYTLLDKDAHNTLITEFDANRGGRLAQKTLAYEVTKIVHGQDKAEAAKKVSEVLFGGADVDSLGKDEFQLLKAELPTIKANGESLIQLIVRSGLASSNSEASRFIASGGIALNGQKVDADKLPELRAGDNLLKRGKNSFAVIE